MSSDDEREDENEGEGEYEEETEDDDDGEYGKGDVEVEGGDDAAAFLARLPGAFCRCVAFPSGLRQLRMRGEGDDNGDSPKGEADTFAIICSALEGVVPKEGLVRPWKWVREVLREEWFCWLSCLGELRWYLYLVTIYNGIGDAVAGAMRFQSHWDSTATCLCAKNQRTNAAGAIHNAMNSSSGGKHRFRARQLEGNKLTLGAGTDGRVCRLEVAESNEDFAFNMLRTKEERGENNEGTG
ncbi:hypothetical protein CPC08DRAFT_729934 [Agrocybe pediades]|nr:hypothetical protein CPC08DRAFT_729934 [Agrocybe pediades]